MNFWIGLKKRDSSVSCTDLNSCSGQLQWLDDESDFVAADWMLNLVVDLSGGDTLYFHGDTKQIRATGDSNTLYTVCQTESWQCFPGNQTVPFSSCY